MSKRLGSVQSLPDAILVKAKSTVSCVIKSLLGCAFSYGGVSRLVSYWFCCAFRRDSLFCGSLYLGSNLVGCMHSGSRQVVEVDEINPN